MGVVAGLPETENVAVSGGARSGGVPPDGGNGRRGAAPETATSRPTGLDRAGIAAGRRARRLVDRALAGPRWPKALVLAAVLVGAILRLVDLHDLPPGLHQDEAIYAYDAYSLAHTGRDHHGHPFNLVAFETFGDWTPPVITMIMAPFVAVFGLRVEVIRAVTAVIGLAGIPLVYLLGQVVTSRRAVGVVGAWLLALSPWHVYQSRYATSPSPSPTLVALALLLLAWTLRHRSDRGLIWTAVGMSVALASYHTLRLYVPLVLLGILPFYWRTFLRFRPGTLAIATAIGLYVTAPSVWFTLRDPAGGARLEQNSVFTKNSLYLPPGTKIDLPFLLGQYLDYVSPRFLFEVGDGWLESPPGGGVELRTMLPFLLVGLAILVGTIAWRGTAWPSWRRGMAGLLLTALIAVPIPAALTLPSPRTLRVVYAMPLLALTAAIGVVAIWDLGAWLGRRRGRIGRAGQGIALVGLAAAAVALPIELADRYNAYFHDYRTTGAPLFGQGFEPVIRFALDHATEYDEIWVSGMPASYAHVLFYSEWDPVDVHAQLVSHRNPPWFNEVYAFDRYRFQEAPPEIVAALPVLETSFNSAGQPLYEVRGGMSPDGTRLLVVRRV